MIYHSCGHTTDQCEYNLLNRQAAPVRQIEPRHGQDSEEERFRRDNRYRPERGERYTERRREDYEVDCKMRTQCMICHSCGHTTDRCEYNLLNRQAAPVRHIEPRHGQDSEEERLRRDNRYRPERGDRYTERRRDDYDHERDERRREGYNRDRYERDYSPEYDRRRDDSREGNQNFERNQKTGYFRREERQEAARDYNQGPSRNTAGAAPKNRKTEETRLVISKSQTGNVNKGESSGNHKVYCY